ncbi:glucose-6-phosphate isomerase [Synechococcus sp. KORDI-100]|uniref:glucose-6-phosphate isomerase n=1 Tax=Synechococcus sp. KORDI-100 TaxID=1280380 RepID=UPI0004E05E88|nr:glucose-6-phosphate isomerase [Synechococcus sp. KORDI-100]AII43465.1 glucose-6-phosphate isomerase [Synechococcus sp. KORDI-100]
MSFPDFNGSDAQVQWQRFCDLLWYHDDLGIWLDISRMHVNTTHLDAMQSSFEKAFAAMQELESGAIANADEQRQVGHYWLRNPQMAPSDEVRTHIARDIDLIEQFGRDVIAGVVKAPNGEPFTDVLWIGIGGSGLGPLLMIKALQTNGQGLPFHFFDNVDPNGMSAVLAALGDKLKTTLVVTVSKSGGTPEPHLGMEQARHRLEAHGGTWAGQAVAVTMLDSKLDQQAREESWLQRFDMFDWVGGRTSITSAVGLLPGALIGCDIREFLAGAAQMDEATRVADLRRNPAALMAASWYVAGDGKGRRDMVVLPYRDRLEVFSRYLQQLVMESLGKRLDRDGNEVHQGIAVYGNKGSTDQHAYVQQLRDGVDNFFATFIECLQDVDDIPVIKDERPGDFLDGFLQGTRSALTEGGRQTISITMRRFDAYRLGALIGLFERAVGFYGELVNINAYHQPGVEAGKKAAAAVLNLQSRVEAVLNDGASRSVSEICQALGDGTDESVFWIMRHLTGNQRGYMAEGDWASPATMRFSKS